MVTRVNPFFPNLSFVGFDSSTFVLNVEVGAGIVGGSSVCPVVAGIMQATVVMGPNGGRYPPLNSLSIRYTVDDVPVGPIITGPDASSFNFRFPSSIDTTVFADGTHALGAICVDATAGDAAHDDLPYNYRCAQTLIIIHNSAQTLAQLYAGPQRIAAIDRGFGPSGRLNSGKADFIPFAGYTTIVGSGGVRNTSVPIPLPQSGFVPPASDAASPLHGLGRADNTHWWTEGLAHPIPGEYITLNRFYATKDGGVYAYGYSAEQGQTLEGDYTSSIKHCNFDGGRGDCLTDQICSMIDGHDSTYWVVFELFGRIIKVPHAGGVTTLAGVTTDRTKLGYCVDDAAVGEEDLAAVLTQVGTIVAPTFGDLRGINKGCWDLTDPVAGNSLIVPNPINHYVAKITGLVNGPVTMFRIVGQDGGLNGAQVNPADNGGFVDGRATEAVAGAGPLALLAGPYHVEMADGVHGPDPLGTLYISDYQNSAIRKVDHTWSQVTTLVGNQQGVLRWGPGGPINDANRQGALGYASSPVNLTSVAWANGVATIVAATPVVLAGVDPAYGTIAPDWTVNLSGGTLAGNFQVLTVTDPSHFTLAVAADPGVVTTPGQLTFYADDVYLPSGPAPRPLANAYCVFPQTAVLNSTGKLVVSHAWFTAVSEIDLAAGTIKYIGQTGSTVPNTRLNANGVRSNDQLVPYPGWFQIDVDKTGSVGPVDDIFAVSANGSGSQTGYYWRFSGDGQSINAFLTNDGIRYLPIPVGKTGGGHYGWGIAINRRQARILTSGLSDTGIASWRAINPAIGDFFVDVLNNQGANMNALLEGYSKLLTGTAFDIFPWGTRPGITSTHGEVGFGLAGLSFDGAQVQFPTDDALATYIQSGMGGAVPAPEFTGVDLRDVIYATRRISVQGSIPGGTAGNGFTPITPLVQPGPDPADVTPPVISSLVVTRSADTQLTVTWFTDKPTWGIACAGFASGHGTDRPYHLFAREAYVAGAGNPSYGTSHHVVIEVHKNALTYVNVVAKDIAGNNAASLANEVTVASGASANSPDGTTILSGTGGSLQTNYGTWDFGDTYATTSPDGNPYRYVRLNGREIVNPGGIEGSPIVARHMVVDKGGNLFILTISSVYNVYDNYGWMFDANYPAAGTTYDPLPAPPAFPFTPSPDGATATPGVGTFTSIDGAWNLAANGQTMLNGIPVATADSCDQLELDNHGQVWMHKASGSWQLWQNQVPQPAAGPPSAVAIPIEIHLTPNFATPASNAPVGTLLATIAVTMSDGSAFAGAYAVGANSQGHAYATIQGNQVVTTVTPIPDAGTGFSENLPVTAQENGVTISKLFGVNPSGEASMTTLTINGVANPTVQPGSTLTIDVTAGPGNTTDWVGIYVAPVGNPAPPQSSISWDYLNGTHTAPSTGLTAANFSMTAPSSPGSYVALFLLNDDLTWTVSAPFTVAVALPVPTAVAFTPASPVLLDSAVSGAQVAAVSVTMSDASAFSGTLTLHANPLVSLSGSNIVLARALEPSDDGAHTVTIDALENGTTVTASFTLQVNEGARPAGTTFTVNVETADGTIEPITFKIGQA